MGAVVPPDEVPCFHAYDIRLAAPGAAQRPGSPSPNPFLIEVRALLEGPEGRSTAVPGFYDGEGTWVVRCAPDAVGEWRYVTQSADPELDGRSGALTCVPNANPRVHGALQVDPAHPHHFRYQDGTRPFVLGYEANWLWALAALPDGAATLGRFCRRIAGYGFNHVFVNAYAHDTRWCPGQSSPEDYGPPPEYAWEGTNEAPRHLRLNVRYWRAFDVMMRALFEQGLGAHLYLKVYNKLVAWPARRSLADDLYFGYVVARYQGFSNVVWDFAKESYNEPDKAYLENRLSLIRARDGYARLLTTHDDDLFDTDPRYLGRTDFVTDQHHAELGATALQRRALRAAPYVNEEFAYECGPGGLEDKTYGRSNTAEEHVLRSWEVVFGGGYPGYYYTYTAWDVIRPESEPPGYRYHGWLADFMRQVEWWRLAPHPEMVLRGGWCLARPGQEYLVFGPGPVAAWPSGDARVVLIGATEPGRRLRADWLHPLTGERAETEITLAPRGVLAPPWGAGAPFVVRLRPPAAPQGPAAGGGP